MFPKLWSDNTSDGTKTTATEAMLRSLLELAILLKLLSQVLGFIKLKTGGAVVLFRKKTNLT